MCGKGDGAHAKVLRQDWGKEEGLKRLRAPQGGGHQVQKGSERQPWDWSNQGVLLMGRIFVYSFGLGLGPT